MNVQTAQKILRLAREGKTDIRNIVPGVPSDAQVIQADTNLIIQAFIILADRKRLGEDWP